MDTRKPTVFLFAALLFAAALNNSSAAVNSIVTQWLQIAQSSVIATGFDHQPAARLYGIVASVQHDVILAARAYKSADISEEAAVAYASHAVLSNIFNWRQNTIFDPLLAQDLARLKVSDALLPALQSVAIPIVQKILTERLRDGSSLFVNFKPAEPTPDNIGRYQFTPGQTGVRGPQFGAARPFHLSSTEVDALTAGLTRFNLTDPEYGRQLQQVYDYGSANSTLRSPYDTDSPRFWALGTGTGTTAGAWLNISIAVLPASTPLAEQALFFRILGTSFWDAAVACYRTKYRTLFWRPITAIRTFHGIIPAKPDWTPLLPTPPHPEYPSGHQCSAGVAVYLLEAFVGANVPFSHSSPGAPDVGPRAYPSVRAAGIESGNSRLFGGMHFNKSNVDGLNLGFRVAQYIHKRKFKSVTFSSRR